MARSMIKCFLFLAFQLLTLSWVNASGLQTISDAHLRAAVELFSTDDGSFKSLEETFQALRTFEVLGIKKNSDINVAICQSVMSSLGSKSSTVKDLFYALKVNAYLKCQTKGEFFEDAISKLLPLATSESSLHDLYHAIGSLVLIKEQASREDLYLSNTEAIFRSIMSLRQSDGRWRHSSNSPESSISASGLALEALAGLVSLSSSEIEKSQLSAAKSAILKLFESMEMYDDGTFYFEERVIDTNEVQSPLSTTSSVVKGVTAFSVSYPINLNLSKKKILGLAKFILSVGIPNDANDLFNQVDSLACLENNRISIPLIVSLPATVLSLTKKDALKVKVNTVLGKSSPPVKVKLLRVVKSGAKNDVIQNDALDLSFMPGEAVHVFDLPKGFDVGSYVFVFEASLEDTELQHSYVTGGETEVSVYLTGEIKVDKPELTVLDSDNGKVETYNKLNNAVSLSAHHLQKLQLSFQLLTPLGHTFSPHQVLVKLIHETKVEHVFVVENSANKFVLRLDFLSLVDKLFYQSGKYDVQLTVGDAAMENSFSYMVCNIDLDLPEPREKSPQPPFPVDPYGRYGPKAEITHIFRAPEKRPPKQLSFFFLALTLLPFLGLLIGLVRLGVNMKNFPWSSSAAIYGLLFHGGIGAVLLLFGLFWIKLDLFTTLKALGLLMGFLLLVGHRVLSHLASSAKMKSA